MIKMINGVEVITNTKDFNHKNLKLRKIAASLTVIGSIFLVGCGNYTNKLDDDISLEAEQDDALNNYRHALKEYQEDKSIDEVNDASDDLEDDALSMIKELVRKTLNLKDTDKVTIMRHSSNSGAELVISVYNQYGDEIYHFNNDNIPNSIRNVMNKYDELTTYDKSDNKKDAKTIGKTTALYNTLNELYNYLDDGNFTYEQNDPSNLSDDELNYVPKK